MSTDTMSGIFDLMEPQGIITEDILLAFNQLFGERLIGEFAKMDVRTLASEIVTRRTTLIPQSVTSIDLAKALLDVLRKLEYIPSTPADTRKVEPVAQSQQKDDKWYRRRLVDAASPERSQISSNILLGAEVVSTARTMSGDILLADTIVLDELSTMSGKIIGHCFAGPNARMSLCQERYPFRSDACPGPSCTTRRSSSASSKSSTNVKVGRLIHSIDLPTLFVFKTRPK